MRDGRSARRSNKPASPKTLAPASPTINSADQSAHPTQKPQLSEALVGHAGKGLLLDLVSGCAHCFGQRFAIGTQRIDLGETVRELIQPRSRAKVARSETDCVSFAMSSCKRDRPGIEPESAISFAASFALPQADCAPPATSS